MPKQRFVLDVHLGKLARYLRMLGFDALWEDDYSDERLIKIQQKERRVILSRDRALLKDKRARRGYLIEAVDPKDQMREVLDRFDLFSRINPFTICLECNGKIKRIRKAKILKRLDAETKKYFNEFYTCRECHKIYWKGSHYDRMMRVVRQLQKK